LVRCNVQWQFRHDRELGGQDGHTSAPGT
jgi:hypothetical protein